MREQNLNPPSSVVFSSEAHKHSMPVSAEHASSTHTCKTVKRSSNGGSRTCPTHIARPPPCYSREGVTRQGRTDGSSFLFNFYISFSCCWPFRFICPFISSFPLSFHCGGEVLTSPGKRGGSTKNERHGFARRLANPPRRGHCWAESSHFFCLCFFFCIVAAFVSLGCGLRFFRYFSSLGLPLKNP